MDYNQAFDISLKLPLDKIPALDWVSSDVKFASTYNWVRGAELSDGSSLGNTIENSRNVDINGRINLEALYNKVPFLKNTNKKFAASSRSSRTSGRNSKNQKKKNEYTGTVTLKMDTSVFVSHNLDNKRVRVSAIKVDGTRYPLKYKVVDKKKIRIDNRDTVEIKLTVKGQPKPEDMKWYKSLQYVTRFAMMVRNVSVTYRNTFAMSLPGFRPEIGDMLGQKRMDDGMFSPGLDFAFGFTDESYLQKAMARGWLLNDMNQTSPAIFSRTEEFNFEVQLEPVRGLKIRLTSNRTDNRTNQMQFMYENIPTTRSGSFTMTSCAIASALRGSSASDGYANATFDKFIDYIPQVAQRLENQYRGMSYPNSGSSRLKSVELVNCSIWNHSPLTQ